MQAMQGSTWRGRAAGVVFGALTLCGVAAAEIINVPADFPTIQEAIEAAVDNDEIVVAPGTYNEPIDFLGKAIVVRSSDGPEVTTLDGTDLFTNIVKIIDAGPSARLDGFTLANGRAAGVQGPALRIRGSATILNCRFRNNFSTTGGGAVNCELVGTLLFRECEFNSNVALHVGGAILARGQPTIANCTFVRNTAAAGGAVHFVDDGSVVQDCFFCENSEPVMNGPFIDGGGNDFAEACPDSFGACCINGECTFVTLEDCESLGGTFQGADTQCEEVECPLPEDTGACCVNGGCAVVTFAECDAIGGEYQGNFTVCEEVECPPLPTTGACCINGGCLLLTFDDCQMVGGIYQGDDVACEDTECLGDVCAEGGTLIEGSGEINDFNAACGSDDTYWAAHGEVFAFLISDPVVQFELTATAPAGFGGVRVDIEASKQDDSATLVLLAQLFNFTTGSYVALPGILALTTADQMQTFDLPAGSDPFDFVEVGTDNVKLLLQTIQTSGLPNTRTQLDVVLFNFE